jgi:hypothetical protein
VVDLNDGKPYHVHGFFEYEKPDDLGLPLPKPNDGDTVTIRDTTGFRHYRFIKYRWYDVGFTPPNRD